MNMLIAKVIGAIALVCASIVGWEVMTHHYIAEGEAITQAKWDAVDLNAAEQNAKETLRRLENQKKLDEEVAKELADAKFDAFNNAADASSMRVQNADIVRRWRSTLSNSPTPKQCAAGGDAIGVLADVLSRADKRAGDLAAYGDASRLAGQECERLYDALTPH
ncbi:MAG: hypothetical protein NVSMB70_01660 [Chamaesiphon sp.]